MLVKFFVTNSLRTNCGQIADKYYFICHDKPRRTKQKIRYSSKT